MRIVMNKSIYFLMIFLSTAVLSCIMFSCDNNIDTPYDTNTQENDSISVTGVSINQSTINVKLGTNVQVAATISPENATDKGVIYESSNTSVAAVDQNGLISGVTEGTAVITVTTSDGGFSTTSTATVHLPVWKAYETLDNVSGNANPPKICFDANGNAIAIWNQLVGSYAHVWSNRYSTETGWGEATLIETQTTASSEPQIAVNDAGIAFVVWPQWNGSYYDLMSNRYSPATGWSTEVYIEASPNSCLSPMISCNEAGDAVVVWRQEDTPSNIWACEYAVGSGWQTPQLVENDDTGNATAPKILFDSSNTAVAIWQQDDSSYDTYIWINRLTDGNWGTPEKIDAGEAFEPQIAGDDYGALYSVWYSWNPSNPTIYSRIYNPAAGWSVSEQIGGLSGDSRTPLISVNSNGTAFAVWYSNDTTENNAWANRYIPGSGWGTEVLLETSSGSVEWPQIACDDFGNAAAVWAQYDGSRYNIWTSYYNIRTGWNTAELLETEDGDASQCRISFDAKGNAIAVWGQRNTDNEIDILTRRLE